jgi:hypothetical protein
MAFALSGAQRTTSASRPPVNLLLAKLILTPMVILAALLVSRRWGDSVGGWLAGLPVTSAPVAGFLAIEHGPAFAATSSAGSVAAVASQASFCIAYTAASRSGWQGGALSGAVGFAGSAAIVHALDLPPIALFGLSILLLSLARLAMPRAGRAFSMVAAPRWEIPARVVLVTAIVVAVTSLAATLGARASGVAAAFPWIGGALAVFAHRAQGAAAGVAVLRGMAIALYSFLAFFTVLGLALTRVHPLVAFVAATAAALAVQAVALQILRGDARTLAS